MKDMNERADSEVAALAKRFSSLIKKHFHFYIIFLYRRATRLYCVVRRSPSLTSPHSRGRKLPQLCFVSYIRFMVQKKRHPYIRFMIQRKHQPYIRFMVEKKRRLKVQKRHPYIRFMVQKKRSLYILFMVKKRHPYIRFMVERKRHRISRVIRLPQEIAWSKTCRLPESRNVSKYDP